LPEPGLELEAELAIGAFSLDVRLSAAPGETVVLVGPSGAGKSTCLDVIAGLRRPGSGRVACRGEVWCDTSRGLHLPPEKRRVGLVFQDYALFPHLSVLANVAYGPSSRGLGAEEAQRKARQWIERLGLADAEGRPVSGLSGGQRQRVALARALAAQPRVLLLDEPFGSLDVTTRGAVRSELRAFLLECDLPTLLVSHDPVDALALGDRIAVLEAGRLSQVGTRDELLSRPRTPFVAELAGVNLYRAELAPGRGLKEARVGALSFQVLGDDAQGPSFVVFAPAEVSLSEAQLPGSARNSFPGRVVSVLPLPDRLRVVLDVGVLIAADVTREAAGTLGLASGRSLWASVKATAIRVYA